MAFALAMLLMLAAAAAFVYLRLHADLDDRVDAGLRSRAAALADPGPGPGPGPVDPLSGVALEDPEESFAQLLSPTGGVMGSRGTLRGPALTPTEARRAAEASVTVERRLPGVDGPARVLARPAGGHGRVVVAVGQSLVDRDDALANVVSSFAVGGAVATLLASMVGYLLASIGLAPVEAMRSRAREVSLLPGDEGLPLPAARDEIRRLAETLNEMLVRLRAAFERESRFVADASHELRTPVAIIKTELEAALQVAGPGSPVHASLTGAVEECDRLAQLAEDLLVIAKAGDGQLQVRPEAIRVGGLLAGVCDRYVDRATRRGRTIRVEAGPDLWLHADPFRVRQALGNLVENALRHGAGEIVLFARRFPGGIEIDVRDEGTGFPKDLTGRAFERFSRADVARSGDGVGLGLAIVLAIAQAHGGTAAVAGRTPTTLRVRFPLGG